MINLVRKNHCQIFVEILIFCFILYTLQLYFFGVHPYTRCIFCKRNGALKQKLKTKYLLQWNTFWNYDICLNFSFSTCTEIKTCAVTKNKSLMPVEKFDAIIFYDPFAIWDKVLPENRSLFQKYVFFSHESPVSYPYRYALNFYNLTINYRSESDIPYPFGTFEKKKKSSSEVTIEHIKNKTKLVTWLVSNKHRTAGLKYRNDFVFELQKFVPVDIYGKNATPCPGRMSLECYRLLDKQYKFYLGFENSLCYEYITEKTYNILKYTNMVPVVLGWADYKTLTPPMSVINADEFKSIKQLADYLLYLDKRDDEYLKYFKWKKHYTINTMNNTAICCKLCEKIHEPKTHWYENLKDWSDKKDGKPTCYQSNKLRISTTNDANKL